MDKIYFENELLPVYIKTESVANRSTHSEIAHIHENIEVILVSRGSIICQTDGTEFELHSGDVCFINRRHMHGLRKEDGNEGCHKVLIVGLSLLMQNSLAYEKYLRPMLEDSAFSHVRFGGNTSPAAEIAGIIGQIETLQEHKEIGYELEIIAAVYRLCKELYLSYTEKPKAVPLDGNLAVHRKMAEFIYENFSEPVTLDDIAKAGSVSRSQCTKLFNRYTKLSPISFLNHYRLETSLDLLRRTTDSIASVAQSCGFSDQSYFNRLFLRQYGCTPSEYRNPLKDRKR